jgi:ATP-binding cassette subfamily B protein/subfamily B ATP-binding cassette protein MsbA
VAVAIVPLLVLAIRVFGREMRERGKVAQQADSDVTSAVQRSIVALPLIQSYTREEMEQQQFTAQAATAQEKRLAQHGWELLYWLAITLVFALGTAAIVWLGSRQVLANRLSVGELMIFLAYLAQLYEPLNQLSHVGATLSTAGAAAQRVFELLDAPEEVRDAPGAVPVARSTLHAPRSTLREAGAPEPLLVQGRVTFERVCFAYQEGQPVLRDVSFEVPAGQSVAIIGPSGAGKTTLLNLLSRFFDPTQGAVMLDGVDLRRLRLRDLRAQVALMLQEPILLPATVAENIAYGRPGATRAEIEAAARAAHAHEFILKLPRQYDTVVGEGAARLSVGEKQRLNLARAFLKDAPLLLLDEPTSALDAESEELVAASLAKLVQGRTTLLVAHRVATVRRAQRILVLHEGKLIEDGTPEDLMAGQGYFARVMSGQVELG